MLGIHRLRIKYLDSIFFLLNSIYYSEYSHQSWSYPSWTCSRSTFLRLSQYLIQQITCNFDITLNSILNQLTCIYPELFVWCRPSFLMWCPVPDILTESRWSSPDRSGWPRRWLIGYFYASNMQRRRCTSGFDDTGRGCRLPFEEIEPEMKELQIKI